MNPHGWLVIDKPRGISSRDAVNRAQRWFPRGTPLGHTGTLDPLADGVLVLAVGGATRLAEYVQAGRKVYISDFVLGATSATDDAEGPIAPVADARVPTLPEIEAALPQFIGDIQQTPPAFSAAKVRGRRAYAEARAGRALELTPRTVHVESIQILANDPPRLRVEVCCGKGTYIRSLARDLGALLRCGAYVATLRRTAVGDFTAAEATPLDADAPRLLPLERGVASLPRVTPSADAIVRLRHGQAVRHVAQANTEIAVFDDAGRLIAIAVERDGQLRPVKVLVT